MCVLALAWHAHPRWRLVLAGNRDELHARAAAPLARWRDGSGIIAGRDLAGGGTWLGVSEAAGGRLAVVTNLRGHGPPVAERASRGALVRDMVAGAGAQAEPAVERLGDFNPFNLIAVAGGEARFLTNRPVPLAATLAPGLLGLANGALDAPWPRTLALKRALREWLAAGGHDPAPLFAALRTEAPAEAPPDAAVFVRDPVYGTRCSTLVTVDAAGAGTIRERRFAADGAATGESVEHFGW